MNNKKIRGLAWAGGGAKGDYQVGKYYGLYENAKTIPFKKGHGTSTGALAILAALTGFIDIIKQAYTTSKQSQITEISMFNEKGMPKVFLIIRRVFTSLVSRKVASIGSSRNLRKLIDQYYTREVWLKLKKENKTAWVGAYSFTKNKVFDACSDDMTFEAFKDFIWASANAPLVMSLTSLERSPGSGYEEFADGGVRNNHNAGLLFKQGCDEVDLYVHYSRGQYEKESNKGPIKNVIHYAIRVFLSFFENVNVTDHNEAIATAKEYNAVLRIHYIPEDLAKKNAFVFVPKVMKANFERGYNEAFSDRYIETHDYTK